MFAEFRDGLIGGGALTPEQFDRLIAWWQAERTEGEGLPAFLVRQDMLTPAGGATFGKALRGEIPVEAAAALLKPSVPGKQAGRTLSPGDWFGSYHLTDQIGRGPRATVFTAEDSHTGQMVALKVYNRRVARPPSFRGGEELPPPASFDHPNCLPVLETGTEVGVAYVAMPYVPAGSAGAALGRRGSMPPAQAARVCRLAAQGLAAAHAAGVPHGNLKPNNILLGDAGQVWLSDFAPRPPGAAPPAALVADLRGFALIIARLVTNQSLPDVPVAATLPRILADVPAPFGSIVAALVADPPAPPCATAAQLANELAAAEATVATTTTAALPGTVTAPLPGSLFGSAGGSPAGVAIGKTLGKCRLIAQIGSGGAGVVYRAEHENLHIDVAVKVLRADSGDPVVRRGLRREARLLAKLNHPNVIRLWDFDESHTPPYLVMEFVDGPTLADLITLEGAIRAERALGLVEQVAQGLAAAHELGIIHRDVKPANVLVGPDGKAKLTDLGLALMVNSRLSTLARPHVAGLAGTIAYLAPEQAVASPTADHRADIYSLGATFFHLITGRVPFPALTVKEMLHKHANEPPPAPHDVAPGVPRAVSPIIQRMLAKDPRDRQQTYDNLFAEFRSLHDAFESARLLNTDPEIQLPDEPPVTPSQAGWWGRLRSRFGGRP